MTLSVRLIYTEDRRRPISRIAKAGSKFVGNEFAQRQLARTRGGQDVPATTLRRVRSRYQSALRGSKPGNISINEQRNHRRHYD